MGIDAVLGWPAAVYQRIGHPVTWLGRLIKTIDDRFNVAGESFRLRRMKGVVALLAVAAAAAVPSLVVQSLLPPTFTGTVLLGVLAWPFVASRSLYDHVAAVAVPLGNRDLSTARSAVAMIVGRDTSKLDEAGVARAAIESLAENASDGIVAPIFWGVLLGLPGIAGYKAINTLDSMIGHRTPRHEAFGWASARVDDVANFVPARFTALLLALVSRKPLATMSLAVRDAKHHRSPNAGWPEAAMAGALGTRLSGPRTYHDRIADEPWLNEGGRDASHEDIWKALRLYLFALFLLSAICVSVALVVGR
jgi:adenosylcobinamide-phosphate synthase